MHSKTVIIMNFMSHDQILEKAVCGNMYCIIDILIRNEFYEPYLILNKAVCESIYRMIIIIIGNEPYEP